jgi:hypothetical protein
VVPVGNGWWLMDCGQPDGINQVYGGLPATVPGNFTSGSKRPTPRRTHAHPARPAGASPAPSPVADDAATAAPRLPRSHSGEAHNPRSYRGGSRSMYSFASFRPIPVSVRTILIASICCPAATSERSSSS